MNRLFSLFSKAQRRTCPACGFELNPNALACPRCMLDLSTASAVAGNYDRLSARINELSGQAKQIRERLQQLRPPSDNPQTATAGDLSDSDKQSLMQQIHTLRAIEREISDLKNEMEGQGVRHASERTALVVCSLCGAELDGSDRFCRVCGARRSEKIFTPERNLMQCVYGPAPAKRDHRCPYCGYSWQNYLMIDRDRHCPLCGHIVEITEEADDV